ncbi:MAG: hypothetical protein K2L37_02805, partial [Lactobacillus sp.]|nr:hypothetical protein [Lactobacillus sp.]
YKTYQHFEGIFDGQGYAISDLVSDVPLLYNVSSGAEVRNLFIKDSKFTGGSSVASNNSGVIQNCHVLENEVSESGNIIGGLVGSNKSSGFIVNCSFRGTVVSSGYAGG